MNETIGEIGGHNDQKRRIRIKREQRKKLDEYEEEREIKDLEKKVKKQQLLTLIKVLPIALLPKNEADIFIITSFLKILF